MKASKLPGWKKRIDKQIGRARLVTKDGKLVIEEPWMKLARQAAKAAGVEWEPELTPEEVDRLAKKTRLLHQRRRAFRETREDFCEKYPHLTPIANSIYARTRSRAKELGVPHSISRHWIMVRLIAGKCEVTGLPFDLRSEMAAKHGMRSNFGPSVDQIVPQGGYTQENCQLVVWCYNAAKGEGSHEEVVEMAEALSAFAKRGRYEG